MNMNTQGGVNVQALHDITGSLQSLGDISAGGKKEGPVPAPGMPPVPPPERIAPNGVIDNANDKLLEALKENVGE
jgi:hypothetical protein